MKSTGPCHPLFRLIFLFQLYSIGITAQTEQFIPLQPENYSGTWINCLKTDQQGNLWIAGTGLTRYDGYSWKTYNAQQYSFSSNTIESICPTPDGLIWVGTKGRGLDCFNPHTEQVQHYHLEGDTLGNMAEEFITVLLQDRDGTLWIGTHNGLYSRSTRGKFTHYPAKPSDPHSLSHSQVRAIHQDRQGVIWVGCGEPTMTQAFEGGLNRLDRKTGKFTQYKAKPSDPHSLVDNRVRAIFEDSQGTLWIGTYGEGLHSLDRQSGLFTRYPYDPAHPEKLSRPFIAGSGLDKVYGISFIEEDKEGNLWIGAYGGGLVRYNLASRKTTRFTAESSIGMADNLLWSACAAQDGTMCFGTSGGHLFLQHQQQQKNQIPYQRYPYPIQAICQDSAGQFWFGTFGGLFIQPAKSIAKTTALNQLEAKLKNERISSVFEDKLHRVWVGTFNQGLFVYNPTTRQVQQFQFDSINQKRIDGIGQSYQSRDGTIWIPSAQGLYFLGPETNQLVHLRTDSEGTPEKTESQYIAVLEDQQGNLWAGGFPGLKRVDRSKGTLKHYLKKETIFQLFEDSRKTLWVVTAEGTLYRYQAARDQFVPFNPPGIVKPLMAVKSIIEDNEHNLWLGTRMGIFKVNPERTSALLFDQNAGFRSSESIYFFCVFKSPDGQLYFGGDEGYYHFYPREMKRIQAEHPPIFLSALWINNKEVRVSKDGPLQTPIDQLKMLALNYRQSSFSIRFISPNLSQPEQIHYQYKLENYDLDWRNSTEHRAEYFKVKPGKYLLKVRAAKSNSVWQERTLLIVIASPWWQTWWAFTLYLVIFIGGVWWLSYYRAQALRRQNRVLEEKVALRTEQLQQSLETLKSTQSQLIQSEKLASLGELTAGIAHEIQNPLNFVNNFAEVSTEMLDEMKAEIKTGNTSEAIAIADDLELNLAKINHHGQRASSIVKGMLEHSRQSRDVACNVSTDLNALADEYLRLAYHGWRAKDSSFNCQIETHFEPDLPKAEVVPQGIGRVLLNLINNAFYAVNQRATAATNVETRHALSLHRQPQPSPTYQPTVTVSTQKTGDHIRITIQDNGNGIPEAIRDKIFQPFFTTKPTGQGTGLGLSLAYDIVVKGHGGEIGLESTEGQGSVFTLKLFLI